jgi:hypothetical protein
MGVIVLAVAVGLPGASAATKKPFTQDLVGAQIGGTAIKSVFAYSVKDSASGEGAGVQHTNVSGTGFPLTGTDTSVFYFTHGLQRTKDSFSLAAPDANGISAVTGKGTCTTGTGAFKTQKCSYTFTGTYDTKTTVAKIKVKGTYTQ